MVKYIILGVVAGSIGLLIFGNWAAITKFSDRLKAFFREVRIEMRRVAWPSQDEVINLTVLVTIMTAMMLVVVGAMDSVFGRVVAFIFGVEE